MKYQISKVTWSALMIALLTLTACSGKYESKGKEIGKRLDQFENKVRNKANDGKETVEESKKDVKKKAHELIG